MIDPNHNILNILTGDCRETLKQIPDGTISTCVTSPPYYGLRDYGTSEWSGGDPECKHVVGAMRRGLGLATSKASTRGGGHKAATVGDIQARSVCPKCGAFRADKQIGLEDTPEEFIETLVGVFREVRRCLRDDGTLWINIGDSYANDTKWGGKPSGKHGPRSGIGGRTRHLTNLPSKSLMGMPWRLAFALQDDGWILRQEIIWNKPNPMPESVRDRCTKAHEQIFLFAKREDYYFNQEAILEPVSQNTHARLAQNVQAQVGSLRANGGTRADRPMKSVTRSRKAQEFPGDALRDEQRRRVHMPNGWANSPRFHEADPRYPRREEAPANGKNRRTFRGGGAYTNGQSFDNNADADNESHGNEANESGLRNPRDVWSIDEEPFALEFDEPEVDFSDGRRTRADQFGGKKHNVETTKHSDGFTYTGTRPQRIRAEEIARDAGLTPAHIDALRACGLDEGKSGQTQIGTGKNAPHVLALAEEAKAVLGSYAREFLVADERNKRSVWTVPTKGFKEAHFATFPPDLIRPCILAGCRTAGKWCDCDEIILTPAGDGGGDDPSMEVGRAGYSRPRNADENTRPITRGEQRHEAMQLRRTRGSVREAMEWRCGLEAFNHYKRTDRSGARPLPEDIREEFRARGWITPAPPCEHPHEAAGVVLDCFGGSGTTGMVAIEEGRRAILCELNPRYAAMSDKRCEITPGLPFTL